ncbi:uncharacterized protein [Lepeophtheirus salmonis]|uniref:uncharacterized protein n=1 Tax=Lepeophtheirus salmonis TaxID=72036 RepID=UPI001AE7CA7A|nr:uncharacterized protein LOC121125484 [Lepeophtheirus salmonis]
MTLQFKMALFCVKNVTNCDRVYDCLDRSDENNCIYYGSSNSSTESTDFTLFGLNAIQWTFSILAIGIPVVILIYMGIQKIILTCGLVDETYEGDSISIDDAVPVTDNSKRDELNRVLDFIVYIDNALDEPESLDKERLYEIFADIHDSPLWLQNIRAFFEILNLLCESDERKIVSFCSLFREMEMLYHEDNVLHMDLCLKNNLGYHFSALFYWNAEPPAIRNFYLKCIPWKCYSIINSQWWKVTKMFLGLIIETLGHFIDLIGDWILFFLLWNILSDYHNGVVPWREMDGQILLFYGFILFFPDFVLSGIYFGRNYRSLYGIHDDKKFKTWVNVLLYSSCIFSAPFLPGYLFVSRFQLAYKNAQIQRDIWKYLSRYFEDKSNGDSLELLHLLDFFERNRSSRIGIRKVLKESKHLEASTETFFHFALQVVLLISINFEQNFGSPVIEIFGAHKNSVSYVLYLNFVIHFVRLVFTRVQMESASKMGFFPDLAKLVFFLFSAFALSAKIFAIILYFAPSLGFFGLSVHFDRGSNIPFNDELGVEDNISAEKRTDYTLLNLSSYYVIFLLSIVVQLTSLWSIKFFSSPRFKKFPNGSILHLFNCLSFPGIFKDWDVIERLNYEEEDEEIDESGDTYLQVLKYSKQYKEVKTETRITILWHSFVNFLLCVPTFINSVKVIMKHKLLETTPLNEEVNAYISAWCLLFIPPVVFLIVQPLVIYGLIMFYYARAHPWSRILAHSKSS